MEWIIMSDELEHAGKRGMHWGERNYQRKDGTWTPLGLRLRRIREGSSGSKRKPSGDAQKRAERKNEIKNLQSKAELENAKTAYKINKAQNKSAVQAAKAGAATIGNKIKEAAKKASEARKEKKREESVEEIVRSGDMKKILSSKDKLTEDELRTAVNRLRLEQDLKDVNAREKARGQETFKKFANTASDVANLTKSGIDIYNNVAKVINTFTDKDLKTIGVGGQESAYTQAMNAARLRQARAMATTAEVNARRSLESESGSSGRATENADNTQSNRSSGNTDSTSSNRQSSSSNRSSDNTDNRSSNRNNSSGWSPQRQAESQSRLDRAMTDVSHANALMTAARSRYGENSSQARQMEQLYRAANTVATAARTSHNEVVNSNPSVQAENRRQAIRDIANMPVQDAVHAVTHRASQLTLSRAVRDARRQQAEYDAQQAVQRLDEANNLLNNVNMDNWRRSMGLDDDYR